MIVEIIIIEADNGTRAQGNSVTSVKELVRAILLDSPRYSYVNCAEGRSELPIEKNQWEN